MQVYRPRDKRLNEFEAAQWTQTGLKPPETLASLCMGFDDVRIEGVSLAQTQTRGITELVIEVPAHEYRVRPGQWIIRHPLFGVSVVGPYAIESLFVPVEHRRCTRCGREIAAPHARFCPFCGTAL